MKIGRVLILSVLTLLVLSCETENQVNNDKNNENVLLKVSIKDWGYIEFNYAENKVIEMICASTANPEYAVYKFTYVNDKISEVILDIYPDSMNSIPRASSIFTVDINDKVVDLTAVFDTNYPENSEEEKWHLDTEGNLIHQERHRGYIGDIFHSWKDGNLIQSNTYYSFSPDTVLQIDNYQYDDQKSPFYLFSNDFLLTMCWISYDFYFDYFEDAILSMNNCTLKESIKLFPDTIISYKNYSYGYLENNLPWSIQIDYQQYESDTLNSSYTEYLELEYN